MKKHLKKIRRPKLRREYRWINLGFLTFIFIAIFWSFPHLTEAIYSRGLFLIVRYAQDFTLGKLPVPSFYLITPLFIIYLIFQIVRFIVNIPPPGYKRWWFLMKLFLLKIASLFSGILFVFFLLWGYNYFRVPMSQQLQLDVQEMDLTTLKNEISLARNKANEAKTNYLKMARNPVLQSKLHWGLESSIRRNQKEVLTALGYPSTGFARARIFGPERMLMNWGTTGFYLPFSGDALIDKGIPPSLLPFITAHEMAHAHGIADEGEANFVAYLTCENSNDPRIKYSGRLMHLLYLAKELKDRKFDDYYIYLHNFPFNIEKDASTLGISGDRSNYSRMVQLITAWRSKRSKKD